MARLVVRLRDPSAKLFRVRNCGGEEDEPHLVRQQYDAFFPNDAPVLVSEQPRQSGGSEFLVCGAGIHTTIHSWF